MGLCSSVLAHVSRPENVRNLTKIVCDSKLDPTALKDAAIKVAADAVDDLAEMPALVEIRSTVDKIIDDVKDIVPDSISDVNPENLIQEIKDLDVNLNKLNRKIFNE